MVRAVYVKSQDSHRLKAMLGARDQLVRAKRALGNQVRGVLRPFGIRLPSRQGSKKFAEVAHQAVHTVGNPTLASSRTSQGALNRVPGRSSQDSRPSAARP